MDENQRGTRVKPNDPNNMSVAEIARSNGELANRLAFAGEYHRRKARKAAATRLQWRETGCEFLMTYVEFRQQSIRNKRRRELGLEPIYLPGEGKPNTIH